MDQLVDMAVGILDVLQVELLENLLSEVSPRSMLVLACTCKHLHKLVEEAKNVWEWMCKRDFGISTNSSFLGRPRFENWKTTYRDLCCLDRMDWVGIPKPSSDEQFWPSPRWGHSMVPLQSHGKILVFAGEGQEATYGEVLVCTCRFSPHAKSYIFQEFMRGSTIRV